MMFLNPREIFFPVAVCLMLAATAVPTSTAQSVETLTAPFNGSGGLSIGLDGTIFVSNFGESLQNADGTRIYTIGRDGTVTVFATGFSGASGSSIDNHGNLIQSNVEGNRLSRVTMGGDASTILSTSLASPVGNVVGPDGAIFVNNCSDNSIRRVGPSGDVSLFTNSVLLRCPNGLTMDKDRNLYAVNFLNADVIKVQPSGATTLFATLAEDGDTSRHGNGHVTFANGVLYATSFRGNQIWEITLDGEARVIAGSGRAGRSDGAATAAEFFRPNGIGTSVSGDTLFVNDSSTVTNDPSQLNPNVVRMITGIQPLRTSVQDGEDPPELPRLLDAIYHNPATGRIVVPYRTRMAGPVTIEVLDSLGHVRETMNEGHRVPGAYKADVMAKDMSAGGYFLRLNTAGATAVKAFVVQ